MARGPAPTCAPRCAGPPHRSCRHLRECVTEFGAQGLELDGVLLAWGTDLAWEDDAWSNIERAVAAFKRDFFGNADILLDTADITRNRQGFESLAGAGLEIADLVVTPLGRSIAGMPPKPDLDIVRSKEAARWGR